MDQELSEAGRANSARSMVGIGVLVVLLVAAVAGYAWWRQGFGADEIAMAQGGNAAEGDAMAMANASPTPRPSTASSQAARAAAEVVAQVTEQQGGLEQRLAAAEQRLTRLDLQAQAAAGNAARAEGLLIALAARRAIEKGAELGYLADQLRLRFGDGWPNAVGTIVSMSRRPVTLDKLIARLEGLEPELREDGAEPSFDRLRREIGSLFIVRRENTPSPQPMRRLERARLFLESGRYEAAIEEVSNMPGAAAADEWIADTRRYAAAQRALDLIETAALLEQGRLRDGAGNTIGQPSPVQEVTPPRPAD